MQELPFKSADKTDILAVLERIYTSREYLDEVLQAVADGITVQNTNGNIVYANYAAARVLGFEHIRQLLESDPKQFLGNFELYDENGRPFDSMDLPGRKALQGQACSAVILKWVRKDSGLYRWAEVKATPIRDSNGQVLFAVNIFHDLTKHKEFVDLENNLMQDHRFVKQIADTTPGMIVVYNINTGKYLYVNDAVRKILGFEPDDLINGGLDFALTLIHPDDALRVRQLNQEALSAANLNNADDNNSIVSFEYRMKHKDGNYRWLRTDGSVFDRKDGLVNHVMNISVDITERKKAEVQLKKFSRDLEDKILERTHELEKITEELHLREFRNNALLEAITSVTWVSSPKGEFLTPQETWGKYTNQSLDEYRGLGWVRAFHQDDRAVVRRLWDVAVVEKKTFEYDLRLWNHETQTYRQVRGRVVPMFSADGTLKEWIGSVADVHDRMMAEQRLAQTARRMEHILESISDGFFSLNSAWEYTYANSRAAEMIGNLTPDRVIGKKLFDLLPNVRESKFFAQYEKAMTQKVTVQYEDWVGSVWISARIYPTSEGIAVYFKDTTEDKKLEETQKFILEASELLSSSLDYELTLNRIAKLAVPKIADWCGVDLVEPEGGYKSVAVAHVDPQKIKFAREVREKYPTNNSPTSGVLKVIRTGEPELYEYVSPELVEKSALNEDHSRLLRMLNIHSIMIVPLKGPERVFGAMTFVWAESKNKYTHKDLQLALELAQRAGIAIDNAMLYKASQDEIRERKRVEFELYKNQERLKLAQKAGRIGTFEWNIETNELVSTPELEALYGLVSGSFESLSKTWVQLIHPDDADRVDHEIQSCIHTGRELDCEYRIIWPDGSLHWLQAKAKMFNNETGTPTRMIGINVDVTEHKLSEERIKYHIYHDSLTDLPNRIMFSECIRECLIEASTDNRVFGLLIIDLDRFKNINDSLGHAIGDRLIQEVGLRLRACIGEKDILARLGGDEFIVLVPKLEREEELAKLSQRILECLRPCVSLEGNDLYITPSIGISLYPYDGRDASSLMKNADSALYRAKEQGRNNYQFYTSTMNARAFEQLTLENTLRKALENKEFVLYYIPQLDGVTGEIVETEALIRWQNPDLGLTFAEEFIHLAENTGLIEEIDEWVLRSACKQTKQWQEAGSPDIKIAVNMSARDFKRKDFVDMVVGVLEETKLAPHFLSIELTERTLVDNQETMLKKLNTLSGMGVKFVIDDFNTDYSSLNYLKQFPMVETIKIGYAFTKGIPRNPKDIAIAKSIILLGHSLNMQVVAEGIERNEQLNFFLGEKCDRLQGYLFSAAVPPVAMTSMIESKRFRFDKREISVSEPQ